MPGCSPPLAPQHSFELSLEPPFPLGRACAHNGSRFNLLAQQTAFRSFRIPLTAFCVCNHHGAYTLEIELGYVWQHLVMCYDLKKLCDSPATTLPNVGDAKAMAVHEADGRVHLSNLLPQTP